MERDSLMQTTARQLILKRLKLLCAQHLLVLKTQIRFVSGAFRELLILYKPRSSSNRRLLLQARLCETCVPPPRDFQSDETSNNLFLQIAGN